MKTNYQTVEVRRQSFKGFASGPPGSLIGDSVKGWEVVVDGKVASSHADPREADFVADQFRSETALAAAKGGTP